MKCEHAIELMSASLDGMLDQAQQERLDAHLADCAACCDGLEQLRRTVSLLHEVEQVEVPPGLRAQIAEAVQPPGRVLSWNWFNYPQVKAALAASIVLVFGLLAVRHLAPPADERGTTRVEDIKEETPAVAPPVEKHEMARAEDPGRKKAPAVAPAGEEQETTRTDHVERRKAPGKGAEAAASPVMRDEAPVAEAATGPLPAEQPISREPEQRTRDRAESAGDVLPAMDVGAAVRRKPRSDSIWQAEAPPVPEGLRVGPSTPLPAVERPRVAPAARPVVAARDGMPEREERPLAKRTFADAMRAERTPSPRAAAGGEAKAARQVGLLSADAAGAVPDVEAAGREDDRERSAIDMASAPPAMRETSSREDARKAHDDGRLAFVVTGVGEERVRAILAEKGVGGRGDRKGDAGVRGMSTARATLRRSDASAQPVVTRLADGRVSILMTIPSADLPAIITALGREGTVRPSRGQVMPGRDDGTVLLELVLAP